MDKIEKLEITRQPGKELNHLDKNLASLVDKINEIVDVLNQSQKQPKGETIRNYNPEKRWDKYKKSKIEVREFDLVPKVQPEKQEEWKEEWGKLSFEIGSITKEQADEIENFISQLLSERTREVLEDLQKEFSEYGVPDDVRYTHPLFYINNIIGEKLSKLSKKKNE